MGAKTKNFPYLSSFLRRGVWGEPTKNGKEIFGFASPLPCYSISYHCDIPYQCDILWIMQSESTKLGLNLKRIRTKKGISQGDIARDLEVSRGFISTIENGKTNPTLATIAKLAKAVRVSVDELLK
jgi:DNA-binding XRE family transcriptional regulator